MTRSVEGTTTNVARERVELMCRLPSGHEGKHHDTVRKESWEGETGRITTLLRDESEAQ